MAGAGQRRGAERHPGAACASHRLPGRGAGSAVSAPGCRPRRHPLAGARPWRAPAHPRRRPHGDVPGWPVGIGGDGAGRERHGAAVLQSRGRSGIPGAAWLGAAAALHRPSRGRRRCRALPDGVRRAPRLRGRAHRRTPLHGRAAAAAPAARDRGGAGDAARGNRHLRAHSQRADRGPRDAPGALLRVRGRRAGGGGGAARTPPGGGGRDHRGAHAGSGVGRPAPCGQATAPPTCSFIRGTGSRSSISC